MTGERHYDEREVSSILERVAELHGSEATGARAMTKAEIEQVVAELGISKALVTRAVSELAVEDTRNRPVWWLGGKTDVMFEEVVEGRIDDATLTQMIEVLRRHLGDPGELTRQGSTRVWAASHSSRTVYFTVVELDGTSTLRLEERMPVDSRTTVSTSAGAGGFLGFLVVVPLKALVVKSLVLLAMGPMAALGATLGWVVGRRMWARTSRSREQQLRQAFSEILEHARARRPELSAAEELP